MMGLQGYMAVAESVLGFKCAINFHCDNDGEVGIIFLAFQRLISRLILN